MAKQRKNYTPQEKVSVLRRHLLEHVPVSELCEELSLRPTVFYRWQKEFFENGAAAFGRQTLADRVESSSVSQPWNRSCRGGTRS